MYFISISNKNRLQFIAGCRALTDFSIVFLSITLVIWLTPASFLISLLHLNLDSLLDRFTSLWSQCKLFIIYLSIVLASFNVPSTFPFDQLNFLDDVKKKSSAFLSRFHSLFVFSCRYLVDYPSLSHCVVLESLYHLPCYYPSFRSES